MATHFRGPLTENPNIVSRLAAIQKYHVTVEGISQQHQDSIMVVRQANYATAMAIVQESAKDANTDAGRCIASLDAILAASFQQEAALLIGKY